MHEEIRVRDRKKERSECTGYTERVRERQRESKRETERKVENEKEICIGKGEERDRLETQ